MKEERWSTMEVKVINEAILDENEQTIFVQRYICPQRTYLVFRKPYISDEQFVISDDAEHIERDVSTWMTEPDDDFPEIFAMVYLDEEYPPKAEEYPDTYFYVEYDEETQHYCCQPALIAHSDLETLAIPTLQEAIEKGITTLDALIEAKR